MESNHRYYSRRASEERRAAVRALTAEARDRHASLADLFERKARQCARGQDERVAASPPFAPAE